MQHYIDRQTIHYVSKDHLCSDEYAIQNKNEGNVTVSVRRISNSSYYIRHHMIMFHFRYSKAIYVILSKTLSVKSHGPTLNLLLHLGFVYKYDTLPITSNLSACCLW